LQLNPRARLSLDLSYRVIRGLTGDTLVTGTGIEGSTGPELDPGESIRYTGSSGTACEAIGVTVSLVLSL